MNGDFCRKQRMLLTYRAPGRARCADHRGRETPTPSEAAAGADGTGRVGGQRYGIVRGRLARERATDTRRPASLLIQSASVVFRQCCGVADRWKGERVTRRGGISWGTG